MSWETLALLVGVGLLVLGGVVRRRFTRLPPPRPPERAGKGAPGPTGSGEGGDEGPR